MCYSESPSDCESGMLRIFSVRQLGAKWQYSKVCGFCLLDVLILFQNGPKMVPKFLGEFFSFLLYKKLVNYQTTANLVTSG